MSRPLGKYLVLSIVSIALGVGLAVKGQAASTQTLPSCCKDRWDPLQTERGMWGSDMKKPGQYKRMLRHWTFIHSEIPKEYRLAENPFKFEPAFVREGHRLYQKHCAKCHGNDGLGDGEIANSLSPSPALLAYLVQVPKSIDSYLLWSVAEGGKEFGTDMPAFRGKLSRDEIWKVVLYMRAGFPIEP